jgi:hypothetical protein
MVNMGDTTKKMIFISIIISMPFCGITQYNNDDLVLFNKGNALYSLVYEDLDIDHEIKLIDSNSTEGKIKIDLLKEEKEEILDVALDYFEDLIDEFPKSSLIYRAMNNAALISSQLNYMDEAIEYYKKIISSKADDNEKGGIGEGIMAEPYALYKNRACKNLAEIYLEQKDFDTALKYIKLTDKYPYQHFCGNEYAANDIYIATLYTRGYYGLNKVEKALSYSLPYIFNNQLASNSIIVELTVTILKEKYDNAKLISDFENCAKNHYTETVKRNKKEWVKYYIDFMNVKIEIPFYSFDFEDDKKIIEEIEESYFYQLLNTPKL